MFSLIGIAVVLGSVIGGFLMEKGKLPVLLQPSEFVTIAGAAVGMAKIVFFVALVLFLISLVFGFSRGSLRW